MFLHSNPTFEKKLELRKKYEERSDWKVKQWTIKIDLPGLCFLPLFHGIFPEFAFEILILLNFSLSSGSLESSSEDSCKCPGGLEFKSGFESWHKHLFWFAANPFGSRVATAFISSLSFRSSTHTKLKFNFRSLRKDFQPQETLSSLPNLTENVATLWWEVLWDPNEYGEYWNEGCEFAISANRI